MSSESESEEFYDAEDVTPNRITRIRANRDATLTRTGSEPNISQSSCNSHSTLSLENTTEVKIDNDVMETGEKEKSLDALVGRKRFRELRQRMQTDDEDALAGNTSPPDSQTSSVDGVYASSNRTSHPFRIIEHDALSLQSMNSLGRVGRILGSNVAREVQSIATSLSTLSTSSRDSESTPSSKDASQHLSTQALSVKTQSAESLDSSPQPDKVNRVPLLLPLQEPDVIASTKSSNIIQNTAMDQTMNSELSVMKSGPVAPPRKKKKYKSGPPSTLKPPSEDRPSSSPLASPASTIESLTREFEHSLDCELPTKIVLKSIDENPKSETSSRSSTMKSIARGLNYSLDIREATKGQYVVKPQDEDKSKAEGPSVEELHRIEKLKNELLNITQEKAETSGTCVSVSSNSIGRYSLGPHRSLKAGPGQKGSRERRRSAGDESLLKQLNMFVRTRTDSGKKLSDIEILEQVTVLNLDTGEMVPLSIAEEKIPQCINPLSLQIMRLTSEYISNEANDKEKESDEESVDSKKSSMPLGEDTDGDVSRVRKRTAKLRRFLGSTVKKTMDKAKSIAQEVSHARHKEDILDIVDEVNPGEHSIKLKASNSHKGPYELENIQHVQELCGEHEGPIWCMKFSCCGRLLATAGQDKILRVWVVRDAYQFFQDMRTKYNAEKVSPTPSTESLVSHHSTEDPNAAFEATKAEEGKRSIFMPKPFCKYTGHTSDLLDVSWSKNYFLLSSSMDKTVRLWHISRKECLCCFQHIDFVTAIVFHPRDDRYFLSGSLDGKLRLWNIPDKKVAVWNEVDGQTKLITAANFCQNGKFAVVGSYDGRCIFYNTDQLKYHTQIHVRSTRGKNSTGRKISGIEPMPGEDKILVTSNDSRIRLYDLCDLSLSCKYKGYVNVSSQIKASFSHDGKYIVSGSENRDIYVWKTHHDYAKFSSVRRDRNDFWEAIKAHNAVVTCAVFAPNPDSIIKMVDDHINSYKATNKTTPLDTTSNKVEDPMVEQRTKGCGGHVLVSADYNGVIKVFINKMKPKHSSLPASALA